jgi:hypothetical protein
MSFCILPGDKKEQMLTFSLAWNSEEFRIEKRQYHSWWWY